MRDISPPPGFDPWTVQPVANRCTDYANPAHIFYVVPVLELSGIIVPFQRRGRYSKQATSWTVRGSSFFFLQNVHTGSVVYPTFSYPLGTAVSSWGVEWPERKVNRSPPSTNGAIPLIPNTTLWRKHQHFTLHVCTVYRTPAQQVGMLP
jgi:hypothetical protein